MNEQEKNRLREEYKAFSEKVVSGNDIDWWIAKFDIILADKKSKIMEIEKDFELLHGGSHLDVARIIGKDIVNKVLSILNE